MYIYIHSHVFSLLDVFYLNLFSVLLFHIKYLSNKYCMVTLLLVN